MMNKQPMKKIRIAIMAVLAAFSVSAQAYQPDSVRVNEPYRCSNSSLMPEFSIRSSVQIGYKFTDITGGVRFASNLVLGVGAGLGTKYYDAVPADDYHFRFFAYHRYYLPLDRNRRISLYSDLMLGGRCVYKANSDDPAVSQKGSVGWLISWQPGLSLRLWGKSNLFVGPTLGPSLGFHVGVAI